MWRKIILLMLLAVCAAPCMAQPNGAAADKHDWIARLAAMEAVDGEVLQSFMQSDPDLVFTTLHDGWKEIKSSSVRRYILFLLVEGQGARILNGRPDDTYRPNKHLHDILGVCLSDPSQQIRDFVSEELLPIAFREINSPAEFQDWRHSTGDTPTEVIIQNSCHAAVRALDTAQETDKVRLLDFLLKLHFKSVRFSRTVNGVMTRGVGASGLIKYVREAALDAGLMETLSQCMKPQNPQIIRSQAVQLLARFGPDENTLIKFEPDLQREVPPLLQKPNDDLIAMLGDVKSRWVTDLLLKNIQESKSNTSFLAWEFSKILGQNGDIRAIPTLIALYDSVTPNDFPAQALERALTTLTNTRYQFNAGHDGDWWRDWWQDHKAAFPEEVRSLPIPKLAGSRRNEAFSMRRRISQRQIGSSSDRVYWLISPGVLTLPSQSILPGLVVVVADDYGESHLRQTLQDIAGRAWEGRYLVALLANPAAAETDKTAWPTRRTPKRQEGAALTTEDMAAAVVNDVRTLTPLNTSHIFLLGEGVAGLAAYACSLENIPMFKGFCLLSSPFRTALLPPLSQAKGKKYYLLHSQNDKIVPFFLAAAAESLLRKQGATVKLTPYKGSHGFGFEENAWEPFKAAIHWLEAGK